MVSPVRHPIIVAAIAATLSSTACLPMLSVPSQTAAATTQSTTTSTSPGGTIRIGKSVRGDLNGVITFAASLQTKGQVAVIPRVTATLLKLDVDLGSRVRAGDT